MSALAAFGKCVHAVSIIVAMFYAAVLLRPLSEKDI